MNSKTYGIRTHVAWLTLLPLLVMVISLETFFLHDRFSDLDRDLITKGQLIARQLTASSEYGVFSNNRLFLSDIAKNALQQPDVRAVVVLNATPEILLASGEMPSALENTLAGNAQGSTALYADELLELVNRDVEMFDNGKTVLLYQPILSAQVVLDHMDVTPAARQTGAVVVEMSWEQTYRLKSRLLWYTLVITAAFLLVTLYLVHLASRRIIDPVRELSDAIRAIGGGDLDRRIKLPSCIAELCTLTHGINQMTADLQHERAILRHRIAQATEQLRNLAFYDTLTLLPNRRLLNDRLTQEMAASSRSGHYGAVMFMDMDNFKALNDQFGHAVGDTLLIEVARRISSCLREMDTVARFGGDEFVVMLGDLDADRALSVKLAHRIAEKIGALLAETYLLSGQQEGGAMIKIEHQCSASIGVALFLNHDASQDDILYWADAMMYQAKKEGRNRICFYDPVEAVNRPGTESPSHAS
ncbi:MAG: diguanylate cyclase [Gallionella sp.]|nr:diguanylate cyclase [Gallionella sp.]